MKETFYERIGEAVCRERLTNGLEVCVVPKPGYAKKYAFFSTRYGGMDTRFCLDGQWLNTPAGIAHYLEHKMFDTREGNALQELAKNGAEPNAFTANAMTAYYFDSTEHFEENLRILLSFVSIPYFTDESVAKEQGIIGQEIRMIEDNPDWQIYTRMLRAMYHRHAARTSIAGTVESIAEITADTLYDCHKAFYTPANMILTVVGDVDPVHVIDLANRVQKFVDCRTKDASRRELYIVEGDSAMGAVKTSRDSEYQAIMPIRGKILNCLKADYARIFKSDVIVDLIKVMGCGVELGGKHNKELATFNLDNLRFNKIVICTDADVDGYQIRTLVLTMLYRLTPTLINEGYVYIAESPLYEITTKDRTYFAYTEPEKATFLEEIGDKKYTIQRSKGLGENDPEMMWLTTMNPESRRLIKVMPTDVERTAQVFDILLGDNLAGRKEHIAQHGAEYLDDLDVS